MTRSRSLVLGLLALLWLATAQSQTKPRITLDEFFSGTSIDSIALSPDGNAVLVATTRADWVAKRNRHDIWLAQAGAPPRLLTSSGHDSDPRWSPNGRWVAFISDRKVEALPDECTPSEAKNNEEPCEPEEPKNSQTPVKPEPQKPTPERPKAGRDAANDEEDQKDMESAQLYVLSIDGGEAIPVTAGREEVHDFSWSPDSRTLYVARRKALTPKQREAHKKSWKDVQRFREDERGDQVFAFSVARALTRAEQVPAPGSKQTSAVPPAEGMLLTESPLAIRDLQTSPDGKSLAFVSSSISGRVEDPASYEIFVVSTAGSVPRQVTHNAALENHVRWSGDNQHLYFGVGLGSVEGPYSDPQTRIYSVDVTNGATARFADKFLGAVTLPEALADGSVAALGRLGTQVQVYAQRAPAASFEQKSKTRGTYESFSVSRSSPRVAVVFSSAQRAPEVYLADSVNALDAARPITNFNALFSQRALPEFKTFQWKSSDGTPVEGVLLYPPGKSGERHLKMFTLIHGGPADANGDQFGADWYDWAMLAASDGWLVFRPNYRGSSGYGDKFQLDISPNLVSVPGRDILTGVDALVREGIADPDRLTIGGYSYGGYMTNWLITQTNEFKAAVTGAGAVEHVANWGNDDLTHDDAWYLGGRPWEQQKRYNDEAAIWQINKVKTPTHMVVGGEDIRVAALESYLLERALKSLNVDSRLLVLPGEGHSLKKNPWHGYIKVREELKWLNTHVTDGTAAQ